MEEKKYTDEKELMQEILVIREVDLEEEKRLCKELLELSDQTDDNYGMAFSYVYLFDSVLALGDYTDCNFYLSKAISFCEENNYDKLYMVLCNLAGLYYIKLNDEQTALEYFLQGLNIAKHSHEYDVSSKIYNNIGLAFAGRDKWETAKSFFEKAYEASQKTNKKSNESLAVSYLNNLAESCIQLGQMEEAREVLEKSSSMVNDQLYYKIRMNEEWSSYYARLNDRENCLSKAKLLYDLKLEEYENKFFVCDMVEDISTDLVSIGEYEWAEKFLNLFDKISHEAPIIVLYRVQCVRIKCLKASNKVEELKKAYRVYYELANQLAEADNSMRSQSMLSKIQLNKVNHEREEIRLEKEVLKLEAQLDKLTGLYNRRYFNKLVSKAIQRKPSRTIGIMMIDIDFFKKYNDHYGHFRGDEVLKKVANVFHNNPVKGISVSRYGGDEFICLCEDVSEVQIDQYIENIQKGIKDCHIINEKSPCSDILTLSIGYSYGNINKDIRFKDILGSADSALYKVKESGRNNSHKIKLN